MKIIETKELAKGYKVCLTQTKEYELGNLDTYDVDVLDRFDGTVYTAHTGCIGQKSGEYWMNNTVELMQRILLLVEAREMAYHNQLCYSTTYGMDTPKNGYEDKWKMEREKASMIEKWLTDLSEYYGKKDKRKYAIQAEFDINEIFI